MLVAKAVTPALLRAQGEKIGDRYLIIDQVLSNVADASSEFLETLDEARARIQKLEESYSRHGYESVSGYGASHGNLKRYRLNRVRRGSSMDREYPYTEFDFDELRNAPSDVLAASLNILADRKINGVPLPDSTVIIAASNSAEDSVNPSPFQTPIQNRFSWYAVTQTPTGWAAGAMNKWGGKMSERERIIRPVIVKAIKEGRASLLEPPGDRGVEVRLDKVTGSSAETEEVVKHAWRSPRSWNRLIVQLASLRLDNRTESDWVNAATHVSNATVGVLGAGEISSELHRIAHRLYTKSTVFSTIQEAVEDATVTVKTKGNQVATQAHFIAAGGELFVNNIDAPYSFDIRSWRERVEDAGLTSSEAVNNHLADVVQGYKAAMKLKYGGFIKRLLSDGFETTQVLNGMIEAMEEHLERALRALPRHTTRQEQLKDFDADARLIKALQATIKDFLNGH